MNRIFKRIILGNDKNILSKSFFWNTLAGIINASQSVLILMILTRTNSLTDAGIFTIAYSVSNLMVNIGKFGVRNLQVTDIKENYKFSTYLVLRIITTILMLLSTIGYLLYGFYFLEYSASKIIIIFLISFLFLIESVEDVFSGRYQQKNRLDIGAKIFVIRWTLILAVLLISLVLFRNLEYSAFAAAVTALFCVIALVSITAPFFTSKPINVNHKDIRNLFRMAFPLFLSSFLTFYMINAPKYAIDAYLSEDVQACYGFISMPVFLIALLNGLIYQPYLVKMAALWEEKKVTIFVCGIIRQLIYILVITIVCLAGAWLVGIPVLSFIFKTDLTAYKTELIILLLGGGMLATSGYFSIILTLLRYQNDVIGGYIIAAFCSFVFSKPLVLYNGILGAAILYSVLVAGLTVIFGAAIIYRIIQHKKLYEGIG